MGILVYLLVPVNIVFKCNRLVNILEYFLYRTLCRKRCSKPIILVSRVLIRKSIDNIFREDISDEIEHIYNFRLLKIILVDFIIQSIFSSCILVELVKKSRAVVESGKIKAFANR